METRTVRKRDLGILKSWIDADQFNRDTMTPKMFLIPKGSNAVSSLFSVNDVPFAFARLRACMRLDVQFNPDRRIVAVNMPEAVSWIAQAARNAKMTQVIFESRSPGLVSFLCDRLKFRKSPDEYVLSVSEE